LSVHDLYVAFVLYSQAALRSALHAAATDDGEVLAQMCAERVREYLSAASPNDVQESWLASYCDLEVLLQRLDSGLQDLDDDGCPARYLSPGEVLAAMSLGLNLTFNLVVGGFSGTGAFGTEVLLCPDEARAAEAQLVGCGTVLYMGRQRVHVVPWQAWCMNVGCVCLLT
jgi:hypothetical protein